MLTSLKRFITAPESSIQGFLSPEELYRSILTALGTGSSVGLAILVLQGVLTNAALVFPNPTVASLATVVLTMVLDLLRRQSQGTGPIPPSHVPGSNPAPTQ